MDSVREKLVRRIRTEIGEGQDRDCRLSRLMGCC